MAADDLNTPLKRDGGGNRRAALARLKGAGPAVLGALGLALVVGFGWLAFGNDPLGGEPGVVLSLNRTGEQPGPAGKTDTGFEMRKTLPGPDGEEGGAAPNAEAADGEDAVPEESEGGVVRITLPNQGRAETEDGTTGFREVGGSPVEAGQTGVTRLARAPARELVEHTRGGVLPRISPSGKRASEVYARPGGADQAGSRPKVAIMISGLGISAGGTDAAIRQLPGKVSLAFAPYGLDLQRWVDKAREDGHEVLLQLPMEPFDYPDNDPGPHTMLAEAEAAQNLTHLHWLMSRMTGYFAVTNYMGAKFTASETALRPVLKEIADRGLAYVEDGASPRSTALSLAGTIDLPHGAGSITIDAIQTREAISEALDRLEATARKNGQAIGVGSALPATVEAVSQWSRELTRRGLVLVPVSSLLASGARG